MARYLRHLGLPTDVPSLGDDFVVRAGTGGTCAGDSGGPALVRLDAIDALVRMGAA
jgi:hypothetical protein